MKTNKKAEKYNSSVIGELLGEITSAEKMQVRVKMQLAARLDDLIVESGFNKSEFASKLDKNPSEISKWLSGTHNFTIDTLVEISGALNIPVQELFAPKSVQVVNKTHIVVVSGTRPQNIIYDTPNALRVSGIYTKSKQEQYKPLTPFYS